jgi:hypothetical protein
MYVINHISREKDGELRIIYKYGNLFIHKS